MTVSRKGLHIAAIVASLTTAGAKALGAQGGAQTRHSRAPAGAAASSAPEVSSARTLQLASDLLHTLTGKWRYEVRFAGNFTGAPDASGTRVFEPLFEDLRLEWTESLDSSSISARGMVGFDPRNDQFYSTAIYSSGHGVELLAGSMDMAEPLILFTPTGGSSGDVTRAAGESFTMRVIDSDHFTWAPLNRAWRTVFTRER